MREHNEPETVNGIMVATAKKLHFNMVSVRER